MTSAVRTAAIATLRGVTYSYPNAPEPALRDVSLQIPEGAFVLVAGPSAGGKSTLLRLFIGLVPQFHGGRLSGELLVAGLDPARTPARRMASVAGMVFQEPEAQAVTDTVEDEVAFGMEQHGIAPAEMRRRIDALLPALGIEHLRARRLSTLSGGERQRVAIAAVLALEPSILLLDEPTSQLDPAGAAAVITVLERLHRERGLTILVAEHRLERLLPVADLVIDVTGGEVRAMSPQEAAWELASVPPVVALYRRTEGKGLRTESPRTRLPLTVAEALAGARTARTEAKGLRTESAPRPAHEAPPLPRSREREPGDEGDTRTEGKGLRTESPHPHLPLTVAEALARARTARTEGKGLRTESPRPAHEAPPLPRSRERGPGGEGDTRTEAKGLRTESPRTRLPLTVAEALAGARTAGTEGKGLRTESRQSLPLLAVDNLSVAYGDHIALRDAAFALAAGETIALVGPNGSGKTTLFRALAGLVQPSAGTVSFDGEPAPGSVQRRTAVAGLVPQDPAIALYHETVREEVGETLHNRRAKSSATKATTAAALEAWGVAHLAAANPRDLSVGQQQRVAIAAMLAHDPRVWLLDEPTRGADGPSKAWLAGRLRAHAAAGGAAIVATHDIESAARFASRVIALQDGAIGFDLPVREALGHGGPMPTQVAQLVPGALTVEEVEPC